MAATLTPSSDSDIKIEVWLPAEGWNGKYQAVGNGGWAGVISYPAMANALREGYATSSTDTGHVGGSSAPLIGHPEKVIDYSHRSVHEMAVTSKKIIDAFYDQDLRLSYWNGCSTGGRQGMEMAQRFGDLFDGILAGVPAMNFSRFQTGSLWIGTVLNEYFGSAGLSTAKINAANAAAVAACDAQDGITDGIIQEPRRCTFSAQALRCALQVERRRALGCRGHQGGRLSIAWRRLGKCQRQEHGEHSQSSYRKKGRFR